MEARVRPKMGKSEKFLCLFTLRHPIMTRSNLAIIHHHIRKVKKGNTKKATEGTTKSGTGSIQSPAHDPEADIDTTAGRMRKVKSDTKKAKIKTVERIAAEAEAGPSTDIIINTNQNY